MGSDKEPDEESQFQAYKSVLEAMGDKRQLRALLRAAVYGNEMSLW